MDKQDWGLVLGAVGTAQPACIFALWLLNLIRGARGRMKSGLLWTVSSSSSLLLCGVGLYLAIGQQRPRLFYSLVALLICFAIATWVLYATQHKRIVSPPRLDRDESSLPTLRPRITPVRYGRHSDGHYGLFIENFGEPAFDVSVLAPVSIGEAKLIFHDDFPSLTKADGTVLLKAYIEKRPHDIDLGDLFEQMRTRGIAAIDLPIHYKDGDNKHYVTNCTIERDVMKQGGLAVRFVGQRIVAQTAPLSETMRHEVLAVCKGIRVNMEEYIFVKTRIVSTVNAGLFKAWVNVTTQSDKSYTGARIANLSDWLLVEEFFDQRFSTANSRNIPLQRVAMSAEHLIAGKPETGWIGFEIPEAAIERSDRDIFPKIKTLSLEIEDGMGIFHTLLFPQRTSWPQTKDSVIHSSLKSL